MDYREASKEQSKSDKVNTPWEKSDISLRYKGDKLVNIDVKVLTEIINSWDPVGLLAGGAPEDEYSIETGNPVI